MSEKLRTKRPPGYHDPEFHIRLRAQARRDEISVYLEFKRTMGSFAPPLLARNKTAKSSAAASAHAGACAAAGAGTANGARGSQPRAKQMASRKPTTPKGGELPAAPVQELTEDQQDNFRVQRAEVGDSVRKLPPRVRTILLMYWQDLEVPQIAATLRITEARVNAHLQTAYRLLALTPDEQPRGRGS